jgi:hypothetical protein
MIKEHRDMRIKKIFIPRKSINKQVDEERFLFYMSNWFLSEMRTLKSLYFFSMNVKDASSLEVYGRNYRTMFLGCLLGAKLWEGWQMLQNCYFPTGIHVKYEPLYSQEAKNSLDFLKSYFNKGKGTIIGKIRNSTFHYPTTKEDKNAFEQYFTAEEDDEGATYFIGETYEQSLFAIDQFIVTFKEKTKAKDIHNAIKIFYKEVQEVIINFFSFLGEYILLFQKKCDFSQEDMELGNVAIRKETSIPFFHQGKN